MCRVYSCLMSVEHLLGDFCVIKHLIFRSISRHIFLVKKHKANITYLLSIDLTFNVSRNIECISPVVAKSLFVWNAI